MLGVDIAHNSYGRALGRRGVPAPGHVSQYGRRLRGGRPGGAAGRAGPHLGAHRGLRAAVGELGGGAGLDRSPPEPGPRPGLGHRAGPARQDGPAGRGGTRPLWRRVRAAGLAAARGGVERAGRPAAPPGRPGADAAPGAQPAAGAGGPAPRGRGRAAQRPAGDWSLEDELRQVEEAIRVPLQAHAALQETAAQLQTVPEIGARTVLPLLVTLGRWDARTAGQGTTKGLVAYAGLDPVPSESGTSVHRHATISRQGNRALRSRLYWCALGAIRGDNLLRAFYHRLVAITKPRSSPWSPRRGRSSSGPGPCTATRPRSTPPAPWRPLDSERENLPLLGGPVASPGIGGRGMSPWAVAYARSPFPPREGGRGIGPAAPPRLAAGPGGLLY